MERFINILIINKNHTLNSGLKDILAGKGNNLLFIDTSEKAIPLMTS